jgi:hypothetical protein
MASVPRFSSLPAFDPEDPIVSLFTRRAPFRKNLHYLDKYHRLSVGVGLDEMPVGYRFC